MNLFGTKIYLSGILLVVLSTTSYIVTAQQLRKPSNEAFTTKERQIVNILDVNGLVKIENKTDFVRSNIKPIKQMLRSGGQKPAAPNNGSLYVGTFKSLVNHASIPELLLGKFQCKGISYWGGFITGEVIISGDNVDANKIWFENLIPGYSNQKVYGTLGSDKVTISIPQGQIILKDDKGTAKLSIHDSNASIKCFFNSSTGVITIPTEYWGAKSGEGWAELFESGATYTRLDMLPPTASFRQPKGSVFLGMMPETWDSYTNTCILGSPYSTWNWKNTNLENNVDYRWDYVERVNGYSYFSTKDSLVMDVQDEFYDTPTLKASNKKGHYSTFVLGSTYKNRKAHSFSTAGGNATWLGFDENCDYGCANPDNGFTLLLADTDAYYFGTGASKFAEKDYESLMVYYEKPQTPIYFEGVNVYLMLLEAPANTKLTLNVLKAEKTADGFSKKGELVASASLLANQAKKITYDNELAGYTLMFENFEEKDEDGFLIEKEYFAMDDAFYLELTGFNKTGVKLAVASEEINPSDGESRSLFTLKNDTSIYYWEDIMQTMYFNLSGAAFSYITLSQNTLYDNKSGGKYTIEAYPYFDTLYVADQEMPNWLQASVISQEYNSKNWVAKVQVTLLPSTEPDSARYYNLVLNTTGASKILRINQGGTVSVSTTDIKTKPKALKNHDGFLLTYPIVYEEVMVVSLSGSVVSRYKLPDNGVFQIQNNNVLTGFYLLMFKGKEETATIKVTM